MVLGDVIQRGTRSAQPLATAVPAGTLYFVTDEGVVERSTAAAWQTWSIQAKSGTYATIPTAAQAGRIYLPTDGVALYKDSGAAQVPWGPLFPLTQPDDSSFAWINQGAASVSTTNGGIFLRAPVSATDNYRIRKKTAPATPYTITAGLLGSLVNLNFQSFGLVFRESASGKLAAFAVNSNTNAGTAGTGSCMQSIKFTNPTTFSADYQTRGFNRGSVVWLRIADDGVNRICSYSADGTNFVQFHSIGRTDFITANEVGFFANDNTNTYEVGVTLISWKEA